MNNKSKLPDFQELTTFATKLFHDLKKSVCEIMEEYKAKRNEHTDSSSSEDVVSSKPQKKERKKS